MTKKINTKVKNNKKISSKKNNSKKKIKSVNVKNNYSSKKFNKKNKNKNLGKNLKKLAKNLVGKFTGAKKTKKKTTSATKKNSKTKFKTAAKRVINFFTGTKKIKNNKNSKKNKPKKTGLLKRIKSAVSYIVGSKKSNKNTGAKKVSGLKKALTSASKFMSNFLTSKGKDKNKTKDVLKASAAGILSKQGKTKYKEIFKNLTKVSKRALNNIFNLHKKDLTNFKTKIKESGEGFIPQGLTRVKTIDGSYTLITAYAKGGKKSRVYFYNTKTGKEEGIVELDHNCHVGGVAYDKKNGILFVSGKKNSTSKKEIYAYDYKQLINGMESTTDGYYVVNKKSDSIKGAGKITTGNLTDRNTASLVWSNGSLYSGTFDSKGKIIKLDYKYDRKNKRIKKTSSDLFGTAKYGSQGLAIDEKNGVMYSTTSIGENVDSAITKIDMKTGKVLDVQKVQNQKGLEGIYVDNKGKIIGICEFGKSNIQCISKYLTDMDTATSVSLKAKTAAYLMKSKTDQAAEDAKNDSTNIQGTTL